MKRERKIRPLVVSITVAASMIFVSGCASTPGQALSVNGKTYSEAQIEKTTRELSSLMPKLFGPEVAAQPIPRSQVIAYLGQANVIDERTFESNPGLDSFGSAQKQREFLLGHEVIKKNPVLQKELESVSDDTLDVLRIFELSQFGQLDPGTKAKIEEKMQALDMEWAPRYGKKRGKSVSYNVPQSVFFAPQQ
ncbi:MAG: hypothetical protein Q4P66_01840 [Actinomycetaceae bacterium]|nr:hypothetical protein [Actinomycetaceae bacterium]